MSKSVWVGAAVVVAMAALPLHVGASTITDGGLEAGFGCTNGFQCGNGSETFIYDSSSASGPGFDPATGVVDIDIQNLLMDLSWTVSSATFVDIAGPDNGVDEVIFTNVSYSGTGLTLLDLGSEVYTVSGSISVDGTYEQRLLGGIVVAAQAFSISANAVSGQCTTGGGPLVCHWDFGPGGPFVLGVGATPANRRFQHTFNLISAPEPSTGLLMSAGLVCLASTRRRRA